MSGSTSLDPPACDGSAGSGNMDQPACDVVVDAVGNAHVTEGII